MPPSPPNPASRSSSVDPAPSWIDLCAPGRLIEFSGIGAVGRTTAAVMLLRRVQHEGELAAWIQPARGSLHPPDLAAHGIDLEALAVIQVPERAGPLGGAWVAEILLRSGAFGLVILDLSQAPPDGDRAWQARLGNWAREHHARVVILTASGTRADSLGPMIGLRIEPRRRREPDGGFALEPVVLKNKCGVPVAASASPVVGPPGYRDRASQAGTSSTTATSAGSPPRSGGPKYPAPRLT